MTRMIKYMVFQTICLMIRVWRITKYFCVSSKSLQQKLNSLSYSESSNCDIWQQMRNINMCPNENDKKWKVGLLIQPIVPAEGRFCHSLPLFFKIKSSNLNSGKEKQTAEDERMHAQRQYMPQ